MVWLHGLLNTRREAGMTHLKAAGGEARTTGEFVCVTGEVVWVAGELWPAGTVSCSSRLGFQLSSQPQIYEI